MKNLFSVFSSQKFCVGANLLLTFLKNKIKENLAVI